MGTTAATDAQFTGNTPFKCSCSSQFADVAELVAHTRAVHNSDHIRYAYTPNFTADQSFTVNVHRAFPGIAPEAFDAAGTLPTAPPPATNDWQSLLMSFMQQVSVAVVTIPLPHRDNVLVLRR